MRLSRNKLLISVCALMLFFITFYNFEEKLNLWTTINLDIEDEEVYTPISYDAYQSVLSVANRLKWNPLAQKDDLVNVTNELSYSIDNLQIRPDKTALLDLYEELSQIDLLLYIPKCRSPYEKALSNAEYVLENINAIDDDVDDAINDLKISHSHLELIPDKSQLEIDYNDALLVDLDLYIPNSTKAMSSALKNAKEVLDDDNSIQADVNLCITSLEDGMNELILKPDKTNLIQLIEKVNTLNEHYYTSESYDQLLSIVPDIIYVSENANATQEDVDDAVDLINENIDLLTKATKGIYRISITFSREYNNHVGNSWSRYSYYKNSEFSSGDVITAPINSTASFSFKIVENDKIPDVGRNSLSITLKDGEEKSCFITVKENRGRYSGNTAQWKITVTVYCVERI